MSATKLPCSQPNLRQNVGFREDFVVRALSFRLELDLFRRQDAWLPALAFCLKYVPCAGLSGSVCLWGA